MDTTETARIKMIQGRCSRQFLRISTPATSVGGPVLPVRGPPLRGGRGRSSVKRNDQWLSDDKHSKGGGDCQQCPRVHFFFLAGGWRTAIRYGNCLTARAGHAPRRRTQRGVARPGDYQEALSDRRRLPAGFLMRPGEGHRMLNPAVGVSENVIRPWRELFPFPACCRGDPAEKRCRNSWVSHLP